MFQGKLGWTCLLLTMMLFALALPASAEDRVRAKDLSNNPNVPTLMELAEGDNRLTATTVPGEPQFVTLNVPEEHVVTGIVLESYIAESDYYVFFAVQTGTRFLLLNDNPSMETLLGWSYFGPEYRENGVASLGTDNVNIGLNNPHEGGTIEQLHAGDYTIMLRQDNNPTTYTLNFVVSGSTAVTTSSFTSNTISHALPLIIIFALLSLTTTAIIPSLLHKLPRSNGR